jgi:hypothetical protein
MSVRRDGVIDADSPDAFALPTLGSLGGIEHLP